MRPNPPARKPAQMRRVLYTVRMADTEHERGTPSRAAVRACEAAFGIWLIAALVATYALIGQLTSPGVPPELRGEFPSTDILQRTLLTVISTGLSMVLCVVLGALTVFATPEETAPRRLFVASLIGEFLLLLLVVSFGLLRLLDRITT